MTVQSVLMWQVVCDRCGAVCGEDDGIVAWTDTNGAEEVASQSEWETDGECGWWCPRCQSLDEVGDAQ